MISMYHLILPGYIKMHPFFRSTCMIHTQREYPIIIYNFTCYRNFYSYGIFIRFSRQTKTIIQTITFIFRDEPNIMADW